MPALTTTPANAPVQSIVPATTYPLTATRIASVPPIVPFRNANIGRVVTGVPIKRWNGSAWVTLFKPRA